MSDSTQLAVPRAAIWLLRLAIHPVLSRTLQRNPVAFATWYAAVGAIIDWPEDVERIRQKERARKLSLERTMRLLSRVNHALSGRASAEHARLVLEGYAVHDWVRRNGEALVALASALHDRLAALEIAGGTGSGAGARSGSGFGPDGGGDEMLEDASRFSRHLRELGRTLRLAPLEQDILAFAFLTTVADELGRIFDQLAADRWTSGVLWTAVFRASADELAKAMRATSPLRLSGLLRPTGRRAQLASVAPFWVDLLTREESLAEAVVEPLEERATSDRPARLLPEDFEMAARLLCRASEPGVNLLLYGQPGLEKDRLLRDIVAEARRVAWRVRRFEDAPASVLPSLTFVAFQLLADRPERSVLVIERPSEVLHTESPWVKALFGVELTADDGLPFDENLLTRNPVPGVWLSSQVDSLPEGTVARFIFHAPLRRAGREERERAMRRRLRCLRLSRAAAEEILKLEGVSGAQLDSAVRACRLAAPSSRTARDRAIVQAVRRSQRALSRDLAGRSRPSVTRYSLDFLNTAGRFTPQQILASLRKRPRGSILLYGPPGTGKTQFTEHLAAELGLPIVSKSASALLSKWLGESEKNIAAAFEEAAAEEAVLFLDEGDSFLRSRELARHSWEVTQTNELLQHMERFDGIVIVATNLFRDLDLAALRRFTFKIEFRELDAAQRWSMFVAEASLAGRIEAIDPGTKERWEERLLLMPHLTPGDFATVKRQCIVLDVQLTPEEWLEQLEMECLIKGGAHRTAPGGRAA
ncbi:MAG: ATP-binding protein [Steroidobacteraceae bacterium]